MSTNFTFRKNKKINSNGIVTTFISGSTTYISHKFTSDGYLQLTSSVQAQLLVVGGAGGGGARGGGGGAGGGVVYTSSFSINSGDRYDIMVGLGGCGIGPTDGTPSDNPAAFSGGYSAIISSSAFVTASGGGGGGSGPTGSWSDGAPGTSAGSNGASGGGGGPMTVRVGGFTSNNGLGGLSLSSGSFSPYPPQGFKGGTGWRKTSTSFPGAGGGAGGASSTGFNADVTGSYNGGNGGQGLSFSLESGVTKVYGSGGGGGAYELSPAVGFGGTGGTNAGSGATLLVQGGSGVDNTGCGGGGGGATAVGGKATGGGGGKGADGVVIITYQA